MIAMSTGNASVRSILLGLGIGDWNATMIIAYMFMAPAQTDPQMSQIILLTKHMQRVMQTMGASAVVTGTIDQSWAPYFASIGGDNWTEVVWFDLARTLLDAKNNGMKFGKKAAARGQVVDMTKGAMSGVLDVLPDVPGGIITYAIAGFLVWRHLKKRP